MIRLLFIFALLLISLSSTDSQAKETTDGWVSLFDGKTMQGWRDFRGKKFTRTDSWKIEDGCLVSLSKRGDIVTTKQFSDFELEFQWKVTDGANSGVFFRLQEDVKWLHESGLEYQVLDNIGQAGRVVTEQAGASYGIYGASKDVTKPVGQWNQARILVRGKHVEHYLNGQKILQFDVGSDDWKQRVARGPLRTHKKLAQADAGHIALQNYHGHTAYFRNLRIRELQRKQP